MNKTLIATALGLLISLAAPTAAWANPVKSLFLGADNGLASVMSDIIGSDVRFDLAHSATIEAQSTTPTLAQLQQYDSVLYWSNYYPANASALGDLLADYVDQGGRVVRATFIGQEVQVLPNPGRIGSAAYAAFTSGRGDAYNSACLGSYDHSSAIMAGVSTLCANYYRGDWNSNLAAGAHLVASWDDGRNFVGVNATDNVIDISLFPNVATYEHATGDYRTLFANALAYNGGHTVPEPGGLALVMVALVGVGAARRKA